MYCTQFVVINTNQAKQITYTDWILCMQGIDTAFYSYLLSDFLQQCLWPNWNENQTSKL